VRLFLWVKLGLIFDNLVDNHLLVNVINLNDVYALTVVLKVDFNGFLINKLL